MIIFEPTLLICPTYKCNNKESAGTLIHGVFCFGVFVIYSQCANTDTLDSDLKI